MSTKRLRAYLSELAELRDAVRAGGDLEGADKLDPVIERLRDFADELDGVLSRLGNPPTDIGR